MKYRLPAGLFELLLIRHLLISVAERSSQHSLTPTAGPALILGQGEWSQDTQPIRGQSGVSPDQSESS